MKEESRKILESVFGGDAEALMKEAVPHPDLALLVEECAIDRIWGREGLPLREKSLITISSQVAMGRWDQVKLHSKSFIHLGGTLDELRNVFIHLGNYCGFPVTVAGFRMLEEIDD